MQRVAIFLGSLMLALSINARPGAAQEFRHYPWCLFTGGSEGGIEMCSFDSFEQCMLTRSGGGGVCFANPAFTGVAEPPAVVAEPPRQPPQRATNQRRRS